MTIIIICSALLLIGVSLTIWATKGMLKKLQLIQEEQDRLVESNNSKSKQLSIMLEKYTEECNQRALYQSRCLELEDTIKEAHGVNIRNEVTRVNCIFDGVEMSSILEGLKLLIHENYSSLDGVRYYVKLTEKVENALTIMVKETESKFE